MQYSSTAKNCFSLHISRIYTYRFEEAFKNLLQYLNHVIEKINIRNYMRILFYKKLELFKAKKSGVLLYRPVQFV